MIALLSKEYFSHYKTTWLVSYPLIFGQALQMIMQIVDNIMIGKTGALNLAAIAFANAVYSLFFFAALGISLGLTPLVGKANGACEEERLKLLFYNSLFFHLVFAIVFSFLLYNFTPYLTLFGQSHEVTEIAKRFFSLITLSIVPNLVFCHFKHFLDGLKITKPAMIALVVANIINIFGNYALIYGHCGAPALGVEGSAISTVFARCAQLIFIVLYFISNKELRTRLARDKNVRIYFSFYRSIVRFGLPIALQMVAEIAYFSFGGIMAGWFGSNTLAAHSVAMNACALTYLMASGIAGGATIRISNFLGEQRYKKMATAAVCASVITALFMSSTCIAILLSRNYIPLLFLPTHETEAVQIAANLLIIGALFQIFDGTQVTSLGILRGLHDTKVPSIICIASYLLVGFSCSYILSVTLNLGVSGIWYGFTISLATAATILSFRYSMLLRSAPTTLRALHKP